jgi:hypothetical protein
MGLGISIGGYGVSIGGSGLSVDTPKGSVSTGDVLNTVNQQVIKPTLNTINDKIIEPIGNAGEKVIAGVGRAGQNIIDDPLPVIEVVVLTYFLGPEGAALVETEAAAAAVASAAVSAANGGKLEDIALNAATAYAGAQIGGAAGSEAGAAAKAAEMSAAEQAMIRQVVASSSSSAATTALRGGSFEQILSSGVSGAVSSYVSVELSKQGFTQTDNKLVAGAVSRATNAILNGKSVADAIGQSIASTTIAAGLQGKLDQLNKNNELGTSLMSKYDSLKQSADDYYTNKRIDELQQAAQKEYDAAIAARDKYSTVKSQFDTAYNTYTTNKAAYEADKTNTTAYDAANAAANKVNELSTQVIAAAYDANNASKDYTSTMGVLKPLQTEYNTAYVAPLEAVKTDITNFNTQQTALATDIGQTTAKYQDQLQIDAADIQKQINDKAAADLVAEQLQRQEAFKEGDWQKAYALDKVGVDPKELGITDENWQENQDKLRDLYITQGGFTKDWQQVGSDKVRLYGDGTGIGINENGEAYKLTQDQVDSMIWNGQLSASGSAYDAARQDTRGYYNELTGEYVYDPLGTLAAPLDETSGTNLSSMDGYTYDPVKRVWTTPDGETVDLGYLQSSGQPVSGSDLLGETSTSKPWYNYLSGVNAPKAAAPGAPKAPTPTTPLPAAAQLAVKSAADQANAMNVLSVLSALDSGGSQDQTQQAKSNLAPEAQFLDWSAPLETNPFKQNSTTDNSGATKMARGGSIDDLVALLKRG